MQIGKLETNKHLMENYTRSLWSVINLVAYIWRDFAKTNLDQMVLINANATRYIGYLILSRWKRDII